MSDFWWWWMTHEVRTKENFVTETRADIICYFRPPRQIRIKAFLRLLWWRMEQRWYYQPQSMVSIKARGVQQGWLSKAEIRDAGLKDTMPAGALGMVAVSVYVCVCVCVSGWVWEWGWVCGCVGVCVCVCGCGWVCKWRGNLRSECLAKS